MIELLSHNAEIRQTDGHISAQSTTPFNVSIGDDSVLALDYVFDSEIDGWNFRFVPGLFLSSELNYANQATKPTACFSLSVSASTPADTEKQAVYNGNPTQRNFNLFWEVSANRKTLFLRLQFYATADLKDWMRGNSKDNLSRLLQSSFDASSQLDNSSDSVYSANKYIGSYLYVEYSIPNPAKYTYESDGITAVITRNDGGSFLVDGIRISADASAFVHDGNGFVDVAINAEITVVSHGSVSFEAGTGSVLIITSISDSYYFSITDANGNFDSQVGETNPSATISGKAFYNHFQEISANFYGESFGTNPQFLLERNSEQVTTLSVESATSIIVSIDNNSNLSACEFMVIRTDEIANNVDFLSDYYWIPYSRPISTSGNTYSTDSIDILPAEIVRTGTYRIVAIWYDSANNLTSSFISDEILVNQNPETLAVPSISSRIANYVNQFNTDIAERIAPYERVRLAIDIDKSAYNTVNTQGGDFDSNINYIKLSYINVSYSIRKLNGNWVGDSLISITDESGLTALSVVRILREWEGETVEFTWEIGFKTEPIKVVYKQVIEVDLFEHNKYNSESLTQIVLKNPSDDSIINDFLDYSEPTIKVEVSRIGQAHNDGVAFIFDREGIQEQDLELSDIIEKLDSQTIVSAKGFENGIATCEIPFSEITKNSSVSLLEFDDDILEFTGILTYAID